MAHPPCMSGDGEPAVFIGTVLTTGDTIAVCENCWVSWAAAFLNAMTGIDPAPFILAISDDIVEGAEQLTDDDLAVIEQQEAPDPRPPSKRSAGRIRAALAEAGTGDDPNDGTPPTENEASNPAA